MAADLSTRNSDNSTILRLLLEHGLDPNIDLRVEGMGIYSNLLIFVATVGHIDQAIALLDHGANVNKTVVSPHGDVLSPLTCTLWYGEHDLCRLFLTRGAIQPPVTCILCWKCASTRAKENTLFLVEMSQ